MSKPKHEEPFLAVNRVSKQFGSFTALNEVSLKVKQGEFVSVLGPSGCGKTTLLRVIAGLERQNAGSVFIGGRDVSAEPVANRGLGIVFQSYALFPNISVRGNVEYGLRRMNAALRHERAMEMLNLVGLADQAMKFPAQLSGGQQQRVALARALAPKPELLLLDEPLSALDARVRVRLRTEIRRIQEKLGVTTVMVTHDQEEALTMADRIVVMDQGRLMQYAGPQDIYGNPANAFVAGFIGAMSFLPNCRRIGPREVRFLDYTLALDKGEAMREEELMLAIRPEHIRLAEADDRNRIEVEVEYVEFRGSVSRAMLQILHPEGDPSGIRIDMDLQPKAVDQMDLSPGARMGVHLPIKHLLAFPVHSASIQEQNHAA